MIYTKLISFTFKRAVKAGIYIDFITRLWAQKLIQNVFIWAMLFVSEKFCIEYLTRFVVNSSKTKSILTNKPLYILTTTLTWLLLIVAVTY